MRCGDIPGRVEMRLYGGLREPLVGREPIGHESQTGVGLRGDETGGQDAGDSARVEHGAAAAYLAEHVGGAAEVAPG